MTALQEKHIQIAQAKTLKVLTLIRLLCGDRLTMKQLRERLNTSKRTVERYIELLEFMDIAVEKGFDKKYFIVPGQCPLCGITTNNTLQ